jgi:glycosyltransferase involved in cell wall biosynthesis
LVLLRVQPPAGSTTLRLRFVKWDRGLVGPLWLAEEPTVEPVDVSRLGTLIEPYSDDRQMLSTFAQIQLGQGELSAHVQTLRRVHELAGTPESANALRRAAGLRRELDPSWRPRVPGSSKIERSEAGNRICHLFKVTYPFESSGGAIRNLNTVKSQREVGLAPYVLTPLDYPATNGIAEFETEELIEGVPHIRLGVRGGNDPSLPLDRRLQYDALLTASVVRSRGADVIHAASGFRGYELALKGLAVAEHFDIPLLYEVRSLHEHLWGDAVHDGVLDREWTRLRTAQEDRCIREADGVVTIAEAMRDVLVARGVDRRKIHVIPNGVDANRFRRVEPAPELRQKLALQGKQVVGYISNLSRREGHDVLIQAFAKLSADHADLRCLIVGDGPLRDEFERLAMSLGVRDRVLFTGEVDHAEINGYYSLIDVFVVPRRADYASDFVTPLKPFEALALERAIVMADRPSLHEIVGNEERGLIFRTGDSDHLAARIAELLADPERRRQLGRDGRRWIFAERTWDQNAKRYKELYANLLASFDSRKRRRRQRVAPETRAVR